MSKGDSLQERRNNRRGRTYLRGQIVFNRRTSAIDCLVRNLSDHGARIEFTDAVAMPGEFDFVIPRHVESRRADLVWRNGTAAGIVFPGAVDLK